MRKKSEANGLKWGFACVMTGVIAFVQSLSAAEKKRDYSEAAPFAKMEKLPEARVDDLSLRQWRFRAKGLDWELKRAFAGRDYVLRLAYPAAGAKPSVEGASLYLNEYDKEMASRGVPVIRYADDIVVLAKSPRAAERLMETTRRYLEGKLKLKMNTEKSKVVSVYSIRNFKFLGFALGKGKNGVYIRVHAKSLKKAKAKLKELTSRRQGRSVRVVMAKVKVYIRGWLGYFGIASMKTTMHRWDEWLRRRLRMYIWKQWKLPRTRVKNLIKLGMEPWKAYRNGNSSKGYWAVAGSGILTRTITNERLARAGYYSISDRYESLHLCD